MDSQIDCLHFTSETAAYEHVEALLWPTGPVCPHCAETVKIGRLAGKTARPGLRKCYACRGQFTVKIGTIFEDSHAPLTVWLQVIYLMCSSKKGISTRQIHRLLGERSSLTTAWHMGHRIRYAMAPGPDAGPLGGDGKTVEVDETYLAKSPKTRKAPGTALNAKPAPQVFSLIERGGDIRSMYLDDKNVRGAIAKHLDDRSRLVTDGAQTYKFITDKHESVDHSKYEWTRGDVHTNTLEGFFSIFKRGLVGVYQHMDKKHLDRYLAEFDFRMNTRAKLGIDDAQRTGIAVEGFAGKRLQYKTAH
jgi:transposase-like protein